MSYDNRQSISRSFFFLQTVALAVGLASIDKAFNAADQDLDQTENEAGKTVEQHDNAAGEKFAASGRAVDNTALAARVNAALNAAPGLGSSTIDVGALDVHVETVKGTVRLSGFVKNPDQKRRAEQLAWSVKGVHSVENALLVQNR
jgi:osmotically-inducible protein OsmY